MHCGPPYISVKLNPELNEPLLLVVDNEPKLELELIDNVEADNVLSWLSSWVMVFNASLNCCNKNCFSSCNFSLKHDKKNINIRPQKHQYEKINFS